MMGVYGLALFEPAESAISSRDLKWLRKGGRKFLRRWACLHHLTQRNAMHVWAGWARHMGNICFGAHSTFQHTPCAFSGRSSFATSFCSLCACAREPKPLLPFFPSQHLLFWALFRSCCMRSFLCCASIDLNWLDTLVEFIHGTDAHQPIWRVFQPLKSPSSQV